MSFIPKVRIPSNGKAIFLVSILAFNLILRIAYVTYFVEPKKTSWPDEKQYIRGAKEFNSLSNLSEYFTTRTKYKREPVYAFFLFITKTLFQSHFLLATRIIQTLLFFASSFLIFRIVMLIGSKTSAWIALIYYLYYPYYIYLPGTILPETIYTILIVLIIFLSIHYLKNSKRLFYILLSVCFVFAFLTKVTVLSIIPIIIFLAYMIGNKNNPFIQTGVFIIIFVFLCSPLWIRNYNLNYRYPLLSRNDPAQMTENPEFSQIDETLFTRVKESFRVAGKNIPGYFTILPGQIKSDNSSFSKQVRWISIVSVLPLYLALLAGLVKIRVKEILFLYLFYLFYALPYLIILGDTRYRLPVDFIGMIIFSLVLDRFFLNKIGHKTKQTI